jgi:hypothetical protein
MVPVTFPIHEADARLQRQAAFQTSSSEVSAITIVLDSTPTHWANQSFSLLRINYQKNLLPPLEQSLTETRLGHNQYD